MKVKLTYTSDIEDVLLEAASMLASRGPILRQCIEQYEELGDILGKEARLNLPHFHERTEELRTALAKLDLRLQEISEIVDGYEQYERAERLRRQASEIFEDASEEAAEDTPQENTNIEEDAKSPGVWVRESLDTISTTIEEDDASS